TIQRRTDGRLDFFRDWEQYRNGFGKLSQEFYLGNELIHQLLMGDQYELRVDLQDFQFNEVHARYFRFSIGDERTNYTLSIAGYDPSSDAGDAMSGHNGQAFSTWDNDNDRWTKNCAGEYGGAWWYTSCHNSNLNGQYLRGPTREYAKGVVWNQWRGYSYSLKRTEMKVRPRF
ncbi:techylectin-5B-like, partial [Amphiura filiformis]